MARKAKSRRPGVKRAVVTSPHNNSSNGSTNGFHKAEPQPLLGENHPLAKVAGSFKDDPFWDEFIQLMKDARREEDERYFKELEDE